MRPVIRQLLFGQQPLAFSPLSLFAAGEQGAWYDPSDFSTMFQDAAGTTPVTGVEQAVGLILDKSGRGNHASQTTLAARPVLKQDENGLYYLLFDGTDDCLFTGNINFSATDKMTVWAGVRKLSDVSYQCIVANGTPTVDTGRFAIFSTYNQSKKYAYQLSGSSSATVGVAQTQKEYIAPDTNIVNSTISISTTPLTSAIVARVNAVVSPLDTLSTYATSPATFANAALIIGVRADNNFWFNGRIYSLIVRGAQSTDTEIKQTERWVNRRTRAY